MTKLRSVVFASLSGWLVACDSGGEPLPASAPAPAPTPTPTPTPAPPAKSDAAPAAVDDGAKTNAAAGGTDPAPAKVDAPPSADVPNAAYFVVRDKGLVVLTDSGFAVVAGALSYVAGFVHGADGKLYVRSSSEIGTLSPAGLAPVATLDYDKVGSVADFDVGAKGEIWVVGSSGVSEHRDGAWVTQSKAEVGLGDDFEVGIAIDADGEPWAATSSSLVRRKAGKWEPASLPKAPTKYLSKMERGPDGQVYLSTYDRIFRLTGTPGRVSVKAAAYESPGAFTFSQSTYGAAQGLESASIFLPANKAVLYGKKALGVGTLSAIAVDEQGRLWAAGDGGIAIAGPGDARVTWRSGSIEQVAGQVSAIVVRGPGPVLPEAGAVKKGGLKGRVLKDGAGVAGVKIELCETPSLIYSRTPCTGAPTHLRGQTDAEGNFTFDGVPLGAYGLAVKSGRKWQITLGAALGTAMKEGEVYDLGAVTLQ